MTMITTIKMTLWSYMASLNSQTYLYFTNYWLNNSVPAFEYFPEISTVMAIFLLQILTLISALVALLKTKGWRFIPCILSGIVVALMIRTYSTISLSSIGLSHYEIGYWLAYPSAFFFLFALIFRLLSRPRSRNTASCGKLQRAQEGGESVQKRRIVWFIAVLCFSLTTIAMVWNYNAYVERVRTYNLEHYGIKDVDVNPITATPEFIVTLIFGVALVLLAPVIFQSKKVSSVNNPSNHLRFLNSLTPSTSVTYSEPLSTNSLRGQARVNNECL